MPSVRTELPFQPVRSTLYSSSELLAGFESDDPSSMAGTLDFKAFRYFVANGRAAPSDPYAGMMQALHDHSIGRAMHDFLASTERPAAAIMGGHGESRDTPNYANVARIAQRMTEAGFLMASGGGPGAMEATHLGALLAGKGEGELREALAHLSMQARLPKTDLVVAEDQDATIDADLLALLHGWAKPAVELMRRHAGEGFPETGLSLAVPTWYYGHEPFSPLASHVAKYFQNSIREDVLLALATNGIVYAEGRAGTLQEVFQDAAQNYYRNPGEQFAPVVFFGKEFWENKLPVKPLLRALFVELKDMSQAEFDANVLITDSIDETVGFMVDHKPSKEKTRARMEALGFGPIIDSASA